MVLVIVVGWALGALLSRWIGLWLGVGLVALLLGLLQARDLTQLRERLQPSPRALVVAAGGAAVMIAATFLLYDPLARLLPGLETYSAALYSVFRNAPPLAAVALPLIILGEELVWRGAVQEAAARTRLPTLAPLAAAALYALAHAPAGSVLLTVLALICGLYWGLLRAVSGGLLAPLLAHLAWDAAVLLIRPLA
jgi:membrane protease YdiL (CAAX protease family)